MNKAQDIAGDGAVANGHFDHEQIAQLAHQLWQERGSPDGSPEHDWFKAEQVLSEQQSR